MKMEVRGTCGEVSLIVPSAPLNRKGRNALAAVQSAFPFVRDNDVFSYQHPTLMQASFQVPTPLTASPSFYLGESSFFPSFFVRHPQP